MCTCITKGKKMTESKIVASIVLLVLVVVLILLFRLIAPIIKNTINQIPKGILLILALAVLVFIICLIVYLFKDESSGGSPGAGNSGNQMQISEAESEVIIIDNIENCIILRDDKVWIDNQIVDMDYVNEYIDYRVENNIQITIVDDYSLSSLHHEITDLCDNKGVNYITEDETWLEQ